jgi:hypothetical protein
LKHKEISSIRTLAHHEVLSSAAIGTQLRDSAPTAGDCAT